MKKLLVLGVLLAGIFSTCSPYTLEIKRGDGITDAPSGKETVAVNVYVNGAAVTSGQNNYNNISSTPFSYNVPANANVTIKVRIYKPSAVGTTSYYQTLKGGLMSYVISSMDSDTTLDVDFAGSEISLNEAS